MILAPHQALWCWLARDTAISCQEHLAHIPSWARQQLSTKTCLVPQTSTPSHSIDRWTKLYRCQDTVQDRATLSRHSYRRTLLLKLVKNAAIVSWNSQVSSHINRWLSIPSRKLLQIYSLWGNLVLGAARITLYSTGVSASKNYTRCTKRSMTSRSRLHNTAQLCHRK